MMPAFFFLFCWQEPDLEAFLQQLTNRPDQIEAGIGNRLPLIFGRNVLFLAHSPNGAPRLVSDHNRGTQRFDPQTSGQLMEPIAGSSWYALRATLEPGSRVEYTFIIDGKSVIDPHNPHQRMTWGKPVSELIMPDYEAYPELTETPARRGRIVKQSFTSGILDNTRDIHIYLPPGYDQGSQRYSTVFFNDGTAYVEEGRIPHILDVLISKGAMEPIIGVFVDPVDRRREYRMNEDFRNMFTRELLPRIDREWRTRAHREARLLVGGSRGGLCAADMALNHSELFSMCAPLAPALNPLPFLQTIEPVGERISFYILACRYDARFYQDSLDLQQALESKGLPVQSRTIPEGHNITAWSRHMDDILLHFFGKNR